MRILFFTFFMMSGLSYAGSEDFECDPNIYEYTLNDDQLVPDGAKVKLILYIGSSIPKDVSNTINSRLGPVNEYYEIRVFWDGKWNALSLFNACYPNGITACEISDYEDFKDGKVTESLGQFNSLNIYFNGDGYSQNKPKRKKAPLYIFFDDGAAFYFGRGSGKEFMSLIDEKKMIFPAKVMYGWKLKQCGY